MNENSDCNESLTILKQGLKEKSANKTDNN